MNRYLFGLCFTVIFLAGILPAAEENPFFKPFDTLYETPPFKLIKNSHFLPAIEEGIKQHQTEIDAIVYDPRPATFQNTIIPLDRSGKFLERVVAVFYSNLGALSSKELQEIAVKVSPLVSAHQDNIVLNSRLFARVRAVYDQCSKLNLDPEDLYLLKNTYRGFVRGGALLTESQKERLREINKDLSLLALKFNNNLLNETNDSYIVIEKEEDLQGLPPSVIALGAETAAAMGMPGKWVYTSQRHSWTPFLQYSQKRDLREALYTAYFMRADRDNENDNKTILQKIIRLRIERSNLLGYQNPAQFILEERMAKKPENVMNFLQQLWQPALKRAIAEREEMQKIADEERASIRIAPWDWWYYAEKLRRQKYDLDDNALRPYFQLENVRKGIFTLCAKLYGLKFIPNKQIQVYHPEVEVYEVREQNGELVGILYLDMFPRDSKQGGAWSGGFRNGYTLDGKRTHPLVTIVCNFTRPVTDAPALLSLDEVITFFHEFGHALNGLFANGRHRTYNIPWDAVELPSQIMEHWALEPEMLKNYARHFKSGEVIPNELIEKLKKSSLFNQGFETVEYLAACFLDMAWHTLNNATNVNVTRFEEKVLKEIGLISEILPRYRSTYFAHIIGGYEAGYYSYIWAGVLDNDAFEAFKERSLFDRKVAHLFRKFILEKLGTQDAMTLYKKFRGREPKVEPLLKKRGLL